MKRREFSLAVPLLVVAGLAACRRTLQVGPRKAKTTWCWTSARPSSAGRQDRGDRVLLVQLPALQCLRAGKLEAWIKKAAQGREVQARAGGLPRHFVPQQRLFYTLEAMGKVDELHRKVFNAIHVPSASCPGQARTNHRLGGQAGRGQGQVRRAVQLVLGGTKASKATQLQDAYKVEGVPAMGIAGRYYTDGTLAGNMDRAHCRSTDYLVAEARKKPLIRGQDAGPAKNSPPAGFFHLSRSQMRRRYNDQQDSCRYETFLPSLLPPRLVRTVRGRGAGRARRPQQAHEHRGRRAALRRPQAVQRLHRQGGHDQGHHRDARRPAGSAPGRARATSSAPCGPSRQAAFFRQKREGLDEYIEGEAESIEYDGKRRHACASSATPSCAACAAPRWPTR
jgi:thiol:disulfide interchange protein DsbA